MTGFGKAVCELPAKNVVIEVKSLNSKQLDLSVKTPYLYKEKELEIRSLVSDKLQRGKVDFSVFFEYKSDSSSREVNKQIIKSYYKQLKEVNDDLGLSSTDLLATIMRLPDVMNTEMVQLDEAEWINVSKAIGEALVQLDSFRSTEGNALANDLKGRIDVIARLLQEIEPHEKTRVVKIKERLQATLEEFVPKEKIDANRLEQELIYYLEKLDISEEKVRLAQHCKYFTETMMKEEFPGRKLGFIAQELGREINTIGSKSNEAMMQKIVVQMKDELEKIKEQVLNVL